MASRSPNSPPTSRAAAFSEAKTVRAYLEALRTNRPSRGRRRTKDTIAHRLTIIDTELATPIDVITELRLTQERINLQAELTVTNTAVDMSALEARFIEVAKNYSDRTGISYTAWRTVGVPAATLTAAGITRT